MDTKCEKVKVKAESKITEKKKDFGDKTGRTRRKMIKMRIQPASVFVDEGEDKIEVGKVRNFPDSKQNDCKVFKLIDF